VSVSHARQNKNSWIEKTLQFLGIRKPHLSIHQQGFDPWFLYLAMRGKSDFLIFQIETRLGFFYGKDVISQTPSLVKAHFIFH